jgi:hypothetical protein
MTSVAYRLDPTRPEYHRSLPCPSPAALLLLTLRRVCLQYDPFSRVFLAVSTGEQRSSRLLSMRSANALLCLPRRNGVLPAGTPAAALLIDALPAPPPDQCHHATASALDHFAAAELRSQEINQTAVSSTSVSVSSTTASVKSPSSAATKPRREISVGILTISDRAHRGVYADESGPELAAQLRLMEQDLSWPLSVIVTSTAIVPDETGPPSLSISPSRLLSPLIVCRGYPESHLSMDRAPCLSEPHPHLRYLHSLSPCDLSSPVTAQGARGSVPETSLLSLSARCSTERRQP